MIAKFWAWLTHRHDPEMVFDGPLCFVLRCRSCGKVFDIQHAQRPVDRNDPRNQF